MKNCWNRYYVSFGSLVTTLIRFPSSWMNSMTCWSHAVPDSMAMETKIYCDRYAGIFGDLQSSCMVGCSRQTGCITNVRLSEDVDDCDIPRNCLSSRPWNECRSIRSLVVITRETDWLRYSGNLSSLYGPPNDVIQMRVSLMSGCTLSARKAMSTSCVYRLAAGTRMRLTSSSAKPCTDRYADHLVCESQSHSCDGRGMKPISSILHKLRADVLDPEVTQLLTKG